MLPGGPPSGSIILEPMTTDAGATAPPEPAGRARRLAAWLHGRPRLQLYLLLAGPLAWLVVAYLGSLAILLLNAFWTSDAFSGKVNPFDWSLDAFETALQQRRVSDDRRAHHRHGRAVTLTDALLAFPIAYYMARVAVPRVRGAPGGRRSSCRCGRRTWSRSIAWRSILQGNGVLDWLLAPFGIRGPGTDEVTNSWIVLSYLWLPYMILPIYAGLERVPNSLLEASADLGARAGHHVPAGDPAAGLAGRGGRIDLHLLADPGRLHRPGPGQSTKFIGNVIYDNSALGSLPGRGRLLVRPDRDHDRVPARGPAPWRVRVAVMGRADGRVAAGSASACASLTGVVLAFIYVPLLVLAIYAFNASRSRHGRRPGFSLHWFGEAFSNPGISRAFFTSILAAPGATAIALVLGTLAALAVQRFQFFGRETISFLLVLPIALPGVVTGIALSTTFQTIGVGFGLATIIVGHATFCVVIAYNNVVARLRRLPRSPEEASADLGADTWMTFRRITLPGMRTALLSGALLAFALSFDEVIVTNFTAGAGHADGPALDPGAPSSARPELPVVNVVALVLIVLASVIPVYFAQRIAGAETATIR